jgi:MFS family permease
MKKISYLRMFIMSLLGFALTFSSNIQDPPLMTFKVRQLVSPNLDNTALGILGFVGLLVAMVVQPIVGVFSDRAKTRLGRRLPFIIGGALLIAVSLFLLASAPTLWVLLLGVILIQFSSNLLQGPWQALIPDLVPESQRGKASSLKAVMDIIALVVGGMVAGMILGKSGIARWGNTAVYIAVAVPTVVFFLFVIITAIWAREKEESVPASAPSRTVGQALAEAFTVDTGSEPASGKRSSGRIVFWGAFAVLVASLAVYLAGFLTVLEKIKAGVKNPSLPLYSYVAGMVTILSLLAIIVFIFANMRSNRMFRFWFANRILFWGAFIAINSFLINYMMDVIGMTQADAQTFYGHLKMILGGALIVLALVAGWLSDKFGRKPIMLIAGLVSFAGAFTLLFVRNLTLISIAGAIVGMGIGAFLTASWALATDIVPPGEAARYMGIANIATCIGSGVARLLGGVLIDPINKILGSSSSGYLLLYSLAAACFLASALVIIPLPNKKTA